ncbi:MAG TPA: efflux RND transporter periplasmic adaptor subunit [Phaeodactylibacter sp.]|nr:efflux RND transporter periplasmic adaptor subunit [Phaeodactylibacter sp.]
MSKKAVRITALIAVVLLVAAFFIFQDEILGEDTPKPEATSSESTGSAPEEAPPIPVEAIVTEASSLRDAISVNGSTVPNEEVAITAEVPGKIEELEFEEGQFVKKGQVLLRLDDEELQAERQRLVVQRRLNQKIAERLKALYEKEGVSLQEYEVAAAEVEKTEAEITLLDAQLEKRVIRAPFAGQLGLRMVSEGSYLSPGTPIVQLISTNPIKLEFDVPEKYSRAVEVGSRVEFRLDGSDRRFHANVIAREPNIDPDTRTLRFKATAPNPGGGILPGAFADVQVELEEFAGTILVPTQAIIPELNNKKVFRYRNGKAEPAIVETGIRQERYIQVVEGLSAGDTVIITGLLQIKPGDSVTLSKIQ